MTQNYDSNKPSALTLTERSRWNELANMVRRKTKRERAEYLALTYRMRTNGYDLADDMDVQEVYAGV